MANIKQRARKGTPKQYSGPRSEGSGAPMRLRDSPTVGGFHFRESDGDGET
jgi:hypothetical protein